MAAGSTVTATVITTSPLMVRLDGCATSIPAQLASGVTVAAGDRVQLTLRTPQMPLISSKETS